MVAPPAAWGFSWTVTTTPVEVPGFDPTAILTVDSTKTDADKLAALEAILYGIDGKGSEGDTDYVAATEPRLPLPAEVIELIGAAG